MLVPRMPLIWLALLIAPLAALAALLPAFGSITAAAAALGFMLVILDALRCRRQLDDIRVVLPEVVRLQKDRTGEIELRITNPRQLSRTIRVGLPFPAEIQPADEELVVRLPPETQVSRLKWSCTPWKRGRYFLTACHLETTSPFKLWARRAVLPVAVELRVYPNLFDERKRVSTLFLNRGTLGIHAQRHSGKGREFEKLREYIAGDSYDDIHWKASAKRGHPVTKVYQIERTQEIYVVVDTSRLSARATGGEAALERFMTAALVLAWAAEQQGDLYGLVTFDDKVRRFIRAKSGAPHYHACRDALYTLQPRIVSPDFDELCSFIRVRLRKRTLLVFLTALDDPLLEESFVRNVELICRQHLVYVNMLKSPGIEPLFANPEVENIDDLYASLGGHLLWNKLRELERILKRRGVHLSLADDERLSAQLVSQYLMVKARQLI